MGPHIGVLYGKYDLLDRLRAYKVRPAPGDPPGKYETGTQNHEGIAGTLAAVNYLAGIGQQYGKEYQERFTGFSGRPLDLKTGMTVLREYDHVLSAAILDELETLQRTSMLLTSSLDLSTVLDSIVEGGRRHRAAQAASRSRVPASKRCAAPGLRSSPTTSSPMAKTAPESAPPAAKASTYSSTPLA